MLCGPDPKMTAMRALFVALGVPDAEIHQEAFISPPTPSDAAAADAAMAPAATPAIRTASSRSRSSAPARPPRASPG